MLGSHQTMPDQPCQHLPGASFSFAKAEVVEGAQQDAIPWPRREQWLIVIAAMSHFAATIYLLGYFFLHHGAQPIPVPALGLDSVHLAPLDIWQMMGEVCLGALAGIPLVMILGLLCVWGRRWSLRIALLCILILSVVSGRELFLGIRSCQQRRANLQALQTEQAKILPRAQAALAAVMKGQQEAIDTYQGLARQVSPRELFSTKTTSSRRELLTRRRLLRQALAACNDVHGQFRHHWKIVDLAMAQAQVRDVARLVEDEEWKKEGLSWAERRLFTRYRAAYFALWCKLHEKHLAAMNQLIALTEPRPDSETGQRSFHDESELMRRYNQLIDQSNELADRINQQKYEPEPGSPDDFNVTDEVDNEGVPSAKHQQ